MKICQDKLLSNKKLVMKVYIYTHNFFKRNTLCFDYVKLYIHKDNVVYA